MQFDVAESGTSSNPSIIQINNQRSLGPQSMESACTLGKMDNFL